VLHALTVFSLVGTGGFRTTAIYDVYEEICRRERTEPLSLRRVRDVPKEHALLDIIEQSRQSDGSAEGSYTDHRLLEDADVVRDVLTDPVRRYPHRSPPPIPRTVSPVHREHDVCRREPARFTGNTVSASPEHRRSVPG
jgi:hypothetical protein